jgi:radical SAM protein with 4Fe4S-binding SPASM domain
VDNVYTQFRGNNPFATQAKMLFHGDRIQSYLLTGDCWPIFCEINLTNRCNLACQWCISENFKGSQDTLDLEALESFVEEFASSGGRAITFSGGGEPTLHPNFASCVTSCRKAGLELGLMTNGAYDPQLNEVIANNVQWIRISLDTLDRVHYKQWKGVDRLDQVLANVSSLVESGFTKVGVNCNIHRNLTIREIDDLLNMPDEYGISYLQFRPVIPRYFKKEEIELNTRAWSYLATVQDSRINYSYDKYKDLVDRSTFPFRACEAHRLSFVVNSNGDVCPCMYHPDDQRFVFGNLGGDGFSTIWKSARRQEVIQFMQHGLNMERECQVCCKLCELNKMFEFLKTSGMDVNFL